MTSSAAAAAAASHAHVAPSWERFNTLRVEHDPEHGVLSYYIREDPRPCFTRRVLEDIRELQKIARTIVSMELERSGRSNIRYLVAASDCPTGVNYGGDLDFFVRTIRSGDRRALTQYALLSIEVLYQNLSNLGTEITTIALVKGTTLGAGFEAALSCDVVIADKAARLGFPEVLFDLFPGMGAYSLLSRRISPAKAEKMILTGRLFSSEELYDLGLVDVVSDEGQTESSLQRYLNRHSKENTRRSLLKIRNLVNPISYDELRAVVELWVDAAFKLAEHNLEKMERLVKLQDSRRTQS